MKEWKLQQARERNSFHGLFLSQGPLSLKAMSSRREGDKVSDLETKEKTNRETSSLVHSQSLIRPTA